MHNDDAVRDGPQHVGEPDPPTDEAGQEAQPDQRSDEELSVTDQQLSDADQHSADTDQRASDRDQASADLERATAADSSEASEDAYELSREERETGSSERQTSERRRARAARQRGAAATKRAGAGRAESTLSEQLEQLRAQVAAGRLAAAEAGRQRERLEAELQSAHLDDLTGAYRREPGALAITHEIERMRRSGGELVLAFIDVDGLKAINDRAGHAAGDRALQAVVRHMRAQLRSFDPIVRYGGDEFVCVLSGTHLAEARHRFAAIATAIRAEAGVGISVGFASLSATDTAEALTDRADAAMLKVKRRHHSS